jgi:ribosomal-protein-alanine N-acetyltransferase
MLKHLGSINLETERLILRKLTINDVEDAFHNWMSDLEIMWAWGVHKTVEETKEKMETLIKDYENMDNYEWGIQLKENNEVIGSICALNNNEKIKSCELGYQISKYHRNKGYATEALISVLEYLIKEIGYNRIQGGHFSDNPASGKVMEKAGMKYEGTLRQNSKNKNGILVDSQIYGILRQDIVKN